MLKDKVIVLFVLIMGLSRRLGKQFPCLMNLTNFATFFCSHGYGFLKVMEQNPVLKIFLPSKNEGLHILKARLHALAIKHLGRLIISELVLGRT